MNESDLSENEEVPGMSTLSSLANSEIVFLLNASNGTEAEKES
jgi:hypothetical protein